MPECLKCGDTGFRVHPEYIPIVFKGLAGEDTDAEIEALKEKLGKKGSRSQTWMMLPCEHPWEKYEEE